LIAGAAHRAFPTSPTAKHEDPVFAAVEAHRKAFLDWGNGSDENIAHLGDIEKEALHALLDEVPTTLAGVVALSRYSAELTVLFSAMDYSQSVAHHPTDEKKSVEWSYYIHRHVADAVLKLTRSIPSAATYNAETKSYRLPDTEEKCHA
jgi:hypothetical protein